MYHFCDACGSRVTGRVWSVQVQSGEPVRLSDGREHIKIDGASRFHVFCGDCGRYAAALLGKLASEGRPDSHAAA